MMRFRPGLSPHAPPSLTLRVAALLALLIAVLRPPAALAASVDFSRDIQPIFADRCFHCHGPDEASRKADLRFDLREGAFRERRGKTVIVPGKREESELWRRVSSDDPRKRMPPPRSNRALAPHEVEALGRWIDEGAPWALHWAFVPPARRPLPAVKRADWTRTPLDCFVLARLEREGLEPSPEAPRETLLRRAALDLTGLPPSPEEVDSFFADPFPDAYERAVDRLLASTRYGERMVWEWLDAARYADSNGYQGDPTRTMWP